MKRDHKCAAMGCKTIVRAELLMCGDHWRIVPATIQRAVWDAYRKGTMSERIAAAMEAIKAVRERTGVQREG